MKLSKAHLTSLHRDSPDHSAQSCCLLNPLPCGYADEGGKARLLQARQWDPLSPPVSGDIPPQREKGAPPRRPDLTSAGMRRAFSRIGAHAGMECDTQAGSRAPLLPRRTQWVYGNQELSQCGKT
ncbi:hypothetical protein EYF80_024948 [Liparis tanakae]|uniref:Uncharacterized protein n=1 Tax=Liparis tanakae TaxID=230148 RepID=A0A4Z2HG59_9TELE|nr:hypothetical protein EYF80_024948 [Liparis tanakae]